MESTKYIECYSLYGLPRRLSEWRTHLQCRRHRRCGFNPWAGQIPWRRAWQPTSVFWPGDSHGQRSPQVAKSRTGLQRLGATARSHMNQNYLLSFLTSLSVQYYCSQQNSPKSWAYLQNTTLTKLISQENTLFLNCIYVSIYCSNDYAAPFHLLSIKWNIYFEK